MTTIVALLIALACGVCVRMIVAGMTPARPRTHTSTRPAPVANARGRDPIAHHRPGCQCVGHR